MAHEDKDKKKDQPTDTTASGLAAVLAGHGFKDDASAKTVAEQNAEARGLSASGPYTVHRVFTKGNLVITVEQNQAPEDVGGLEAVVTHPPCAVIASPKGRVAFNPDDTALALKLVAELS